MFCFTQLKILALQFVVQLLQRAMEMIGGKWKLSLLCSLMVDGSTRYNELKRKMNGISNTMLAKPLKEMEDDGLVTRTEYMEVPIRVEYAITEKAKALGRSWYSWHSGQLRCKAHHTITKTGTPMRCACRFAASCIILPGCNPQALRPYQTRSQRHPGSSHG